MPDRFIRGATTATPEALSVLSPPRSPVRSPAHAPWLLPSLEPPTLLSLSSDLLVRIIALLPSVEDIGRLDCVCKALHRGYVPPPPPRPQAPPVEEALRQRAASAGYPLPDSLPDGEHSWTQKLCWDERRRRFGERAVVAGGMYHSVFIEGDGTLLTCGSATLDGGRPGLLGHGTSVEVIETPRAVPGLLGVRVRTIAAAEYHSLAVSEEGVGYSWGYGGLGRLGHGDETDVHSPRQVAYPFGVTAGSSAAVVASAAGAMGGLAALSLAAATQHHLEGSHASAGSGDGGGASGGARGGARGGGSGVRVVACAAANCHTLLLSSTGLCVLVRLRRERPARPRPSHRRHKATLA